MQIASLNYDSDTGVLDLRLDTGEEYKIEHAGHALTVKDKISIGGDISSVQREWLEQYRVAARETNRAALREKLKELREGLRG